MTNTPAKTSVFRFTDSYLVHYIRLVPLALHRSPQRCSETRRPWHRFHDLVRRSGIRLRDIRSPSLSAPCRSRFIHNLICIVSITASSQDADFAASTSSLHCSPLILPLARLLYPSRHSAVTCLNACILTGKYGNPHPISVSRDPRTIHM